MDRLGLDDSVRWKGGFVSKREVEGSMMRGTSIIGFHVFAEHGRKLEIWSASIGWLC